MYIIKWKLESKRKNGMNCAFTFLLQLQFSNHSCVLQFDVDVRVKTNDEPTKERTLPERCVGNWEMPSNSDDVHKRRQYS